MSRVDRVRMLLAGTAYTLHWLAAWLDPEDDDE